MQVFFEFSEFSLQSSVFSLESSVLSFQFSVFSFEGSDGIEAAAAPFGESVVVADDGVGKIYGL